MKSRASRPAPAPTVGRRRAASQDRTKRRGLGAPGLPRPSWQRKRWRYGIIVTTVALLVAWVVWYATTPSKLPVEDKVVTANTVVATPIYVGMFTAPGDFDRTLRVAGIKTRTTANAAIKVTPVLCRRGTVGVTTDLAQFCSDMVNPEGQRLVAGDTIVLRVESDSPAVAIIDRIRIAYREDIRWDTQPAGNQQAIVTVAGRPDAS